MPTRATTGHRIPWTGRTLNPGIFGCTLAGPECLSCYAATTAHRGLGPYGDYTAETGQPITEVGAQGVTWTGAVYTDISRVGPAFAKLPRRKRDLVFLTSMADIHHADVPADFLVAVYAEIAARPHLTFQVLTKRPELMAGYLGDAVFVAHVRTELARRHPDVRWPGWPLRNVWPGTSMGDDLSPRHDRVRALLATPCHASAIRFLSVEPCLTVPDLRGYVERHPLTRASAAMRQRRHPTLNNEGRSPIGWVILGGEAKRTRRRARPFDLAGARQLIDYISRCGDGVHVQVKQLGTAWAERHDSDTSDGTDPAEWPVDLRGYYGVPEPLARLAGLA